VSTVRVKSEGEDEVEDEGHGDGDGESEDEGEGEDEDKPLIQREPLFRTLCCLAPLRHLVFSWHEVFIQHALKRLGPKDRGLAPGP